MKEIDPAKKLIDIVMFDGVSNVQLSERIVKVHYPNLTIMIGVEHIVSLFFNDVSKISIINQMISTNNIIYNILVLVYIKSLTPYLNPNINSFTIETLVCLVEKRL